MGFFHSLDWDFFHWLDGVQWDFFPFFPGVPTGKCGAGAELLSQLELPRVDFGRWEGLCSPLAEDKAVPALNSSSESRRTNILPLCLETL